MPLLAVRTKIYACLQVRAQAQAQLGAQPSMDPFTSTTHAPPVHHNPNQSHLRRVRARQSVRRQYVRAWEWQLVAHATVTVWPGAQSPKARTPGSGPGKGFSSRVGACLPASSGNAPPFPALCAGRSARSIAVHDPPSNHDRPSVARLQDVRSRISLI